jgi:hypothetical protein
MPAGSMTTANPAAATAMPPVAPKRPAVPQAPAASSARAVTPMAVIQPQIVVPPPPITAAQATRLQELDAKYSADQISPTDYFIQREAILKGQ